MTFAIGYIIFNLSYLIAILNYIINLIYIVEILSYLYFYYISGIFEFYCFKLKICS